MSTIVITGKISITEPYFFRKASLSTRKTSIFKLGTFYLNYFFLLFPGVPILQFIMYLSDRLKIEGSNVINMDIPATNGVIQVVESIVESQAKGG